MSQGGREPDEVSEQWHDIVPSMYQESNFGISESMGQSKEISGEAGVGVWTALNGCHTRPGAVEVERYFGAGLDSH